MKHISEINSELRAKSRANKQRKDVSALAEVNRELRLKSPAGKKAALDELAKRQVKPAAKAPAKQPVKPDFKAMSAALNSLRSYIGSLISLHEENPILASKRTLDICLALQCIEKSLSELK